MINIVDPDAQFPYWVVKNVGVCLYVYMSCVFSSLHTKVHYLLMHQYLNCQKANIYQIWIISLSLTLVKEQQTLFSVLCIDCLLTFRGIIVKQMTNTAV